MLQPIKNKTFISALEAFQRLSFESLPSIILEDTHTKIFTGGDIESFADFAATFNAARSDAIQRYDGFKHRPCSILGHIWFPPIDIKEKFAGDLGLLPSNIKCEFDTAALTTALLSHEFFHTRQHLQKNNDPKYTKECNADLFASDVLKQNLKSSSGEAIRNIRAIAPDPEHDTSLLWNASINNETIPSVEECLHANSLYRPMLATIKLGMGYHTGDQISGKYYAANYLASEIIAKTPNLPPLVRTRAELTMIGSRQLLGFD